MKIQRKMKNKKLAILLVLLFALLLLFTLFAGKTPPPSPIAVTTLQNEKGEIVTPHQEHGQVMIITYFKSWCRDCRMELPELEALQKAVGGESMLKVLLITDEYSDAITVYRSATKTTLPIYHCIESMSELGIKRFPTTYLLNKKGEIVAAKVEGIRWNTKKNQDLVQTLNR